MYEFLQSLPAILGISGFVVYLLLKKSITKDPIISEIIQKLRTEAPDFYNSLNGLSDKSKERLIKQNQEIRTHLTGQDNVLLSTALKHQFFTNLFVYIICVILILTSIYLFFRQSEPRPETYIPPECSYEKISFIILRSDHDYTRSIETAFINKLNSILPYGLKKCVITQSNIGSNLPYDSAVKKDYFDKIHNIIEKGTYDYYVTIGTSSSLAIKEYFEKYPKKKGLKKIIFLGVSDPVCTGLADALADRDDRNNITGVAYAGNYERLPELIHRIYPNRKIEYIYNSKYSQDECVGFSIHKSPLVRNGILKIVALDRQPIESDFTNPDIVYFSWMTIEAMFENEGLEIIKTRNIVSTTAVHAEHRLVPYSISTSDKEIGELGADLVYKIVSDPNIHELGKIDIPIPKWIVYANCNQITARGLTIESLQDVNYIPYDCN